MVHSGRVESAKDGFVRDARRAVRVRVSDRNGRLASFGRGRVVHQAINVLSKLRLSAGLWVSRLVWDMRYFRIGVRRDGETETAPGRDRIVPGFARSRRFDAETAQSVPRPKSFQKQTLPTRTESNSHIPQAAQTARICKLQIQSQLDLLLPAQIEHLGKERQVGFDGVGQVGCVGGGRFGFGLVSCYVSLSGTPWIQKVVRGHTLNPAPGETQLCTAQPESLHPLDGPFGRLARVE